MHAYIVYTLYNSSAAIDCIVRMDVRVVVLLHDTVNGQWSMYPMYNENYATTQNKSGGRYFALLGLISTHHTCIDYMGIYFWSTFHGWPSGPISLIFENRTVGVA